MKLPFLALLIGALGNDEEICYENQASKCEKEYHYCHLMFAGECWITKVVTVLVDCKKKAKKCCPGFIQDSSTSKFKCIAESGCGGASKLTQSSGSIHSANYPAKYEADLNCQWRIEAPPNHLIQLDFSKVDLEDSAECRFDKVQIADSNSERIICGRREPLTIMSSSNYLDVTFKSDDATEYTGFSANYTFVSEKSLENVCEAADEVWKPCNKCQLTCEQLTCSKTSSPCEPGCGCPADKPIKHKGRCITLEQCPNRGNQCGRSDKKLSTRIMGGSSSSDTEWPWASQLLRYNELICGSTLIASNWLLTAAHCFIEKSYLNLKTRDYLIVLGSAMRPHSVADPFIKMFIPELIYPHPRFSYNTNSHDIALIGLPESVIYSSYIKPACLPQTSFGMPVENDRCTVIGWGKTLANKHDTELSTVLNKVSLTVENDNICHNMYLIYNPLTQMCLNGENNANTCEGDSGGPLLCDGVHDRGWTIHGITSFGTTCGQSGPPVGVYTRVQHYIGWLESICGNDCNKSVTDVITDGEEVQQNIAKLKSASHGAPPSLVAGPSITVKEKSKKQINWEQRRSQRQEERQRRLAYRQSIRNKKAAAKQARVEQRARRKKAKLNRV